SLMPVVSITAGYRVPGTTWCTALVAYRFLKPCSVVTLPNSGTFGGPLGEVGRVAGDRAAHRDPARAPAARAELRGRGVALCDHPLRAVDEVADRVDLVRVLAGEMPLLAVLAAAAHVRDRDDAAALEKREPPGAEGRIARDAVRAVRVQHRRIAAVELHVAAVDDGQRYYDAVPRGDTDLVRDDAGVVDRRRRIELRVAQRTARRIVRVPARRLGPAFELQQEAWAVELRGEARDRAVHRERDLGARSVVGDAGDSAEPVFARLHVHRVAGGRGVVDDARPRGDDVLRVGERLPDLEAHETEAWCVLRRERVDRVAVHRRVRDEIVVRDHPAPGDRRRFAERRFRCDVDRREA